MSSGRIFAQKPQPQSSSLLPSPKPAPRRNSFAADLPSFPDKDAPGFRRSFLHVPAHPDPEKERQWRAQFLNKPDARAVVRGPAQAKLEIGAVDDPLEREADRVANEVADTSASPATGNVATPSPAAKAVQRKCAACEDEESMHRKAADGAAVSDAPANVYHVLRSPGRPLDAEAREFMESRFGQDFSQVRIHDDARAHESARDVRARAYTVGSNVVFGAGQYRPETADGRKLLAHELTHVVQQGRADASTVQRAPTTESQPSNAVDATSATNAGSGSTPAASNSRPVAAGSGKSTPTSAKTQPVADGTRGGKARDCAKQAPTFVAGIPIFFDFDSTTVLPKSAADLKDLIDQAPCATAIEVHGNASTEGDADYNEELACRRAETIANVLQSAARSTRITKITHGETSAFGVAKEDNRNAVVVMDLRTKPAPLPPSKVVPSSMVPVTIGHSKSFSCGSGTDFTFHDFPSVSSIPKRFLVDAADRLSDAELYSTFHLELVTAAGGGAPGADSIAQFRGATGRPLVHGPTSILGTLAVASPEIAAATSSISVEIEKQARLQAGGGALDYHLFSFTNPPVYWAKAKFGFGSGPLAAVIGGTHGSTLSIFDFKVLPCTRFYTATVRWDICDNFGVDESDLYSPGLAAFWVLQHRRGGVPFINELVFDLPIVGTY